MQRLIKFLLLINFILFSEDDVKNSIQEILPSGFEINFIEKSELKNFYVVNVLNLSLIHI